MNEISSLNFQTRGCCGEYSVATVVVAEGVLMQIYDDGIDGYRVLNIINGMLSGDILRGLTADEICQLLPG